MLTGYHGTTQESAKSILKEKQFKLSQSNKEWLGEGIYFYEQFSDAYNWRNRTDKERAVLHSVIEVNDDEYLDIDSDKGGKLWREAGIYVSKDLGIEFTMSVEEAQCRMCKLIWEMVPIKVLAASFATEKTLVKTLIDKRTRRREFCVKSNESIKCTQIINYEG